jgi:hypothetical protein
LTLAHFAADRINSLPDGDDPQQILSSLGSDGMDDHVANRNWR